MAPSDKAESEPLLAPESGKVAAYGTHTEAPATEKKSKKKEARSIFTIGLYRFATGWDLAILALGFVAAIIHGVGQPILAIIMGGMTNTFLQAQTYNFTDSTKSELPNSTLGLGIEPISSSSFQASIIQYCLYYAYLGIAMFITSYIQITMFELACERQVYRLRKEYLRAILRQDIAWFDEQQSGALTSRLSDDLDRVREGLGDKFSLFIQFFAAFISGFIVGFIYDWRMTLAMMALTPLLAIVGAWMGRIMATRTKMEQEKYAVAGGIAEEVLSCIRTVLAFNGQKREAKRYGDALAVARSQGLWKYFYMGIGIFLNNVITFGSYAVAFWVGSLIVTGDPSFPRGTIFTVFFAVMNGSTALGQALPNMNNITMAMGAGKTILDIIAREPKIDAQSDKGHKPPNVKGHIQLQNVSFSYPLRKDVQVLNDVNFEAKPGQRIAFVGQSGCGKSTIVNLLLRFYDPDNGIITLDGHDLRDLNVHYLRNVVGVVSQEPILFDGTLEENIKLGKPEASISDIHKATQQANAYKFISQLPQGLNTRVGERGVQLSGGQKQRIAIARALISDPKVLILDEATSALDTESESLVQKALDHAQQGRTTIMIAHRLSTIKEADQIFVLDGGNAIEQGSYHDLMEQRGVFYKMVLAQQLMQSEKSDDSGTAGADYAESVSSVASSIHRRRKSTVDGRQRTVSTVSSLMHQHKRSRAHTKGAEVFKLEKEMQDEKMTPVSMKKLYLTNRESWGSLFLGFIGCLINGSGMPLFALLYSQIFNVYSETGDQLKADALFWSLMFLALGFLIGLGWFIGFMGCGRAGENMTMHMRLASFTNLLRQDAAYFDDERHGVGQICTRFATDAPTVRFVFTRLPIVTSSIVSVCAGIILAFIFGWKLALIALLMIPLIMASGYIEMKMLFGKQLRDARMLEYAGKIASEAVENIRTVQALTREQYFHDKYCNLIEQPFKENQRHAHVYGVTFGFAQCVIFFMYAVAFWLGGTLVANGEMMPVNVYRVFFSLAFCGQAVGQVSAFIPDIVKARSAAALLFSMIEVEPLIDGCSTTGDKPTLDGTIQFHSVYFNYPTRPGVKVLQGLDLSVNPGQTLALVGASGCGKSTAVLLLERFYDPLRGEVLLDGSNLRSLNLPHIRNQMGLVSQEPVLFDCTIRENIVYGMEGQLTHDQVVEAAKLANIHDTILGLPMGYETRTGERGAQLSGGQKQRVAIARALVRRPRVLLLDEATSALDSAAERQVQAALDNASRGRTVVAIAHRLATVQNADKIAVIRDGRVVEVGTHTELLEKHGSYYALCQMQELMPE